MKKILLAISLFLVFAPEISPAALPANAKVEKLVGTALFGDKNLKEGEELHSNGVLKTKTRSTLRLFMRNWNSSIVIGPNTKMDLDLQSPKEAKPQRYILREGICRWISFMKSALLKESHVHTKSASMGIRGTDFEIKNNDKTGETEIIVFSGEVLLKSKLAQSEVLIKKGQWGGVGGKFGDKVNKPVDLSEADLATAKKRTEEMVSTTHKNYESDESY